MRWGDFNLQRRVRWAVPAHTFARPTDVSDDKPAVIYAPTGEITTRKQLKDSCQRLAYGLRNSLGLKPGDVG